ncbi:MULTISPECIES: helix-turn-helix transcriptional regulator [unclassified Pseudactinotalea]|uniref:ArsR/SmtB family transcription factor n=1 Tax=unclassified Pseudactinotalea TaxID=2649176 RepID=UPI00128D0001|nr:MULTISPECIES: metalloregulator ArsR/SmtB family transcription factor [unclassified Pseudactinotalea]MPV49943.1 metalloregulator ArsR/SmtB family transcription factor [Pseudactinotalea sp. HY160]QGH69204.1 metalloregulator ArsR/SmtB family transcription factor [Pseudactinotalea sp. HY158]
MSSSPPSTDADCVTSLAREPIAGPEAVELARLFKALGDPSRLRLLSLIAAHEGGRACVCDLTEPLGLSQPTVSHHLRVLREAGLVTSERRGTWVHYSLVPAALDRVAVVAAIDRPR